jgi:hypothetical protein
MALLNFSKFLIEESRIIFRFSVKLNADLGDWFKDKNHSQANSIEPIIFHWLKYFENCV